MSFKSDNEPEFHAWRSARHRCTNPRSHAWKNYGGRGIRMCAEWAASFEAFLAAVGKRPSRDHSLDRIDNDRGYEPGNVRWSTRAEQSQNTRRAHSRSTVNCVRLLLSQGFTKAVIARSLGTTFMFVARIAHGETWRISHDNHPPAIDEAKGGRP